MPDKTNRNSPLVKCVLALDNYLSELERIGAKINATDMTSDLDIDHIQKLMTRFAACGQGVSEEVNNLSTQLREAQARAETVAEGVTRQAELLNIRRKEENQKLEEFRVLGEKVRDLNTAIGQFRDGDRATLRAQLPVFESQLTALIGELQAFRESARAVRMRALAKSAESLMQTLQTARTRIQNLA